MPDVWSTVADLDPTMQRRLGDVLETRGADPQQRAMRMVFLDSIPFPDGSTVLEVGCGTGVLTRQLAAHPSVAEVVGVDLAGSLLERARELSVDHPQIEYLEGDARDLPVDDDDFDVVVFDSTLSHVPDVDKALTETARVLRPGGRLAAFDGDYATATVALGDQDPLQECVNAMMANSVNDRYVMRRLASVARRHGFEVEHFQSHGFVDTSDDGYMVTVVERGIDLLLGNGQIGEGTATALRAEVTRRAELGLFFGHVAYLSLIARL
ncbi:MAG TPA: methyltransferase domain-containing protein [Acidimicrobiia bacterium]|nr:methyltransferase domain-containing protein [Acidimicrobiia bacterium]